MTTPNIGLTELANNQQNYLKGNESFAVIDAILQTRAISKTLTAAPGSPVDGDVYIMQSAWAGITTLAGAASVAGDIAFYRTSIGVFKAIRPKEGWKIELALDDTTYRFDGSAWVVWSAGGGGSSIPATQTVSSSAGVLDLSATTAPVILVTLTENITSITLPAGVANQSIERRIKFTQGGAGTYTVTGWPGTMVVEGGLAAQVAATGVGAVTEYFVANDNATVYRMYVDQGTGALVGITSVNGGQLAGFRRKNINGNFNINQLALSGTVTLAAGDYGHDGWKGGASGCTYTFAKSANVTTLTITAGSLQQVVDGEELFSGTHALSWVGTAQGKIGAGSYSASGVTGSVTGGTNITIEFNTGTLSLAQFEPGSASSFEHRPELPICQRHYNAGALPFGALGAVYSGGLCSFGVITFPQVMRAIPTYTCSAGTPTSGGTFGTVGALQPSATVHGCRALFLNTGGTQGAVAVTDLTWAASARL